MAMVNTLVYYNVATITAVKSFTLQAPGSYKTFFVPSGMNKIS
jgi:hypothetical protein